MIELLVPEASTYARDIDWLFTSILLTVGFYSMMARLTESTRVELDVDGGPEVVAALRERAASRKPA